ncbi:hypothetical protein BGW38_007480 [Lunasporangiospora selenospora]|uniref:Uncharacterized protein n=1 Tax=Lunasporangiospora selenospora TaxID=979761 RepID=A0A9P6FMF6_9FUNG|nr:hypothetical protein BGW38_007480 [Lunasporangiospora selenospora]
MKFISAALALTLLQFTSAAFFPKDSEGNPLVDDETYCVYSYSGGEDQSGLGYINTQGDSWLRLGTKGEQFTFKSTTYGNLQAFTLAKNKVFKMSGEKTRLPCSQSFMKTDKGGSLDLFFAEKEFEYGRGYSYVLKLTGQCGFGMCGNYDVLGIEESGTNIPYLYAVDDTCGQHTSPTYVFDPKSKCD